MLSKTRIQFLLSAIIFCVLIATLVIPISSCQKNADCTAVITVNDTVGTPLSGASVKLYYTPTTGSGQTPLTTSQTTDGSGKTTFVFKLQAIYDIDVTYLTKTATKVGIIKLEPGGSVSKTVIFK